MDILAHSLWVGAGLVLASRRRVIEQRVILQAMAVAAVPDVMHALPLVAWWLFGSGSWSDLRAYALATPGAEPALPAVVALASHHLHCIAHSALMAAAASALLWWLRGALWLPLVGWWAHIAIDVFTHSADFYPAPVLYPITQRGFDGLAWNSPLFMLVNYAALAVVGLWLLFKRRTL